ncbi:MAG: hypothetical protein KGN34_11445 [Sphingomonadales bacterium]|nr:hypothetical protein [Sphingomonadales bacterium]
MKTGERLAAPLATAELNAVIARLGDAIAALDAHGAGNDNLCLAAAHAETALHLVVTELVPDVF